MTSRSFLTLWGPQSPSGRNSLCLNTEHWQKLLLAFTSSSGQEQGDKTLVLQSQLGSYACQNMSEEFFIISQTWCVHPGHSLTAKDQNNVLTENEWGLLLTCCFASFPISKWRWWPQFQVEMKQITEVKATQLNTQEQESQASLPSYLTADRVSSVWLPLEAVSPAKISLRIAPHVLCCWHRGYTACLSYLD